MNIVFINQYSFPNTETISIIFLFSKVKIVQINWIILLKSLTYTGLVIS